MICAIFLFMYFFFGAFSLGVLSKTHPEEGVVEHAPPIVVIFWPLVVVYIFGIWLADKVVEALR